jgi:hypothetical protein
VFIQLWRCRWLREVCFEGLESDEPKLSTSGMRIAGKAMHQNLRRPGAPVQE